LREGRETEPQKDAETHERFMAPNSIYWSRVRQPRIPVYLPYTEIWTNLSIRMLMKTSTDFCLLDEEGYLNIRYHAGP